MLNRIPKKSGEFPEIPGIFKDSIWNFYRNPQKTSVFSGYPELITTLEYIYIYIYIDLLSVADYSQQHVGLVEVWTRPA